MVWVVVVVVGVYERDDDLRGDGGGWSGCGIATATPGVLSDGVVRL